MGLTEFLTGGPPPSNLPDAIYRLEGTSRDFLYHWPDGNLERAGRVSKEAMKLFDFIANELLREKVERKGSGTYAGSAFEAGMGAHCGIGVTGVLLEEQRALVRAGAGNGRLPANRLHVRVSLDKLLNKIKHRKTNLGNFRVDHGHHVLLISTDNTNGSPEGVYEFEVAGFCKCCSEVASHL